MEVYQGLTRVVQEGSVGFARVFVMLSTGVVEWGGGFMDK